MISLTSICLFCLVLVSSSECLKINRLLVPLSVSNGTSPLILGCEFDLEGEVLYSVKWYKNYLEFYRFLPSNVPTPGEAIEMKGTVLDVSRSNSTHVYLNFVDLDSEGIFTCEVSTESPSYQSVRAEEIMQVYVLPSDPVRIDGNSINTRLDVGDFINLTCISGPSKPAPSLSWVINGAQALPNQVIHFPVVSSPSNGMMTRRLGLTIQASSDLFVKGLLKVICSSRIILAYHFDSSRILSSSSSSSTQDSSAFYMTDGYNVQRTLQSPVISGGKSGYRMNDWVNLNCSTTYQASHLRWFINDIDAGNQNTVNYQLDEATSTDSVQSSTSISTRRKSSKKLTSTSSPRKHPSSVYSLRGWTLGLRIQIRPVHFQQQQLTLRCQSITYDILQESSTSLKITSNKYNSVEGQSLAANKGSDKLTTYEAPFIMSTLIGLVIRYFI